MQKPGESRAGLIIVRTWIEPDAAGRRIRVTEIPDALNPPAEPTSTVTDSIDEAAERVRKFLLTFGS